MQPGDDLGRGTEHFHRPVAQKHDFIAQGQGRSPVRDQHDGAPAFLQGLQSSGQGLLSLRVEMRVRLIENDQYRIAEQGAGKADALALSP